MPDTKTSFTNSIANNNNHHSTNQLNKGFSPQIPYKQNCWNSWVRYHIDMEFGERTQRSKTNKKLWWPNLAYYLTSNFRWNFGPSETLTPAGHCIKTKIPYVEAFHLTETKHRTQKNHKLIRHGVTLIPYILFSTKNQNSDWEN